MATANRMFFALFACWIPAISGQISRGFAPQTGIHLKKAVRTCFPEKIANAISKPIPGKHISIQYCGGWGYGPKSHALKKQLEDKFGDKISVREIKDPGTTGNFEVVVNNDLIWSKKTREQSFPDTQQKVDSIIDSIKAASPNLPISIQYCDAWGYGPESHALKKKLENALGDKISVREIKDTDVTGNFEVVAAGDLIWSKKLGGQFFPNTQQKVFSIINAIKARQRAQAAPTTAATEPFSVDVSIQYCGAWGYQASSKWLKMKLENAFDNKISVQEIKDTDVTGNFEVLVDNNLVWSKKTRGQDFPTSEAAIGTIIDEIRDRQNREKY